MKRLKRQRQEKYKTHPRAEMTPLGKRQLLDESRPSMMVTTGRLVGWTWDGNYMRICRDYHKSVDTYHPDFWRVIS